MQLTQAAVRLVETGIQHISFTGNRDDKCSKFLLQETGIQHTSVADAAEILADPLRPPSMPKLRPLLEQQVHHLVLQPHTNATQSEHTRRDRETPSRSRGVGAVPPSSSSRHRRLAASLRGLHHSQDGEEGRASHRCPLYSTSFV